MRSKFAERIEEGLKRMAAGLQRQHEDVATLSRRVGRLLERNQRASVMFEIQVAADAQGKTQLAWKRTSKQAWAELSEGCYLLRTNISDWLAGRFGQRLHLRRQAGEEVADLAVLAAVDLGAP